MVTPEMRVVELLTTHRPEQLVGAVRHIESLLELPDVLALFWRRRDLVQQALAANRPLAMLMAVG